MKPAMEAARKGSAKKMRRRTPIFQTVLQASPSDGAVSTGSRPRARAGAVVDVGQRGRLPTLRGEHLLGQLELFVPAAGRFAQAQADQHHDAMGTAKKKKGARQDQTAASPAPSSTPMMAPRLIPERCAE